eukprot:15366031-Ditylum_brightwellii.AAC.1
MAPWRSMVNLGETMASEGLLKDKSHEEGTVNLPSKKKESKGKKRQQRLTKQRSSELRDDTVRVNMSNDDKDYTALCLAEHRHPFGHGGNVFPKSGLGTNSPLLRMRRVPSAGMSNGCTRLQLRAVIDPGKEEELIGKDR